MKILIAIFVTLLGFAGMAEAQSDNESLFVVLTSDDAETQMMAMVLATQSHNKDVPVRVLLCSNAAIWLSRIQNLRHLLPLTVHPSSS